MPDLRSHKFPLRSLRALRETLSGILLDAGGGPGGVGAAGFGEEGAVAGDHRGVDVGAVVPEVEDGRGIADRMAAHAGVRKALAQLLVLGTPAEALVVAVDAQHVAEEGRRVATLPGRAARRGELEQPADRRWKRVPALVPSGGALECAGVDLSAGERLRGLAGEADHASGGEAPGPRHLQVPREQAARREAVSVGEQREVAAQLPRAADGRVDRRTLAEAARLALPAHMLRAPAAHHLGGLRAAAVVRDDDAGRGPLLERPGAQRQVEPARLLVRRHDDGGAHVSVL